MAFFHLFTPFDDYEKTKIHIIAFQNKELFNASILNQMVVSHSIEVISWQFGNNYRNRRASN
jgi:hypothetical protein